MKYRRFAPAIAAALGGALILGQMAFAADAPKTDRQGCGGCCQGGKAAGKMVGPRGGAGLNLTDAQKAKIQPIMKQAREKIAALRSDKSLTIEARRTKAREIMANARKEMRAILTPEQQKKLDAAKTQRGAGHKQGTKRVGMVPNLSLSDTQKASVRAIVQKSRGQIQSIRGNAGLSASAKQTRIQRIRQSTMEQIRGILTSEQLRKLDARNAAPWYASRR